MVRESACKTRLHKIVCVAAALVSGIIGNARHHGQGLSGRVGNQGQEGQQKELHIQKVVKAYSHKIMRSSRIESYGGDKHSFLLPDVPVPECL